MPCRSATDCVRNGRDDERAEKVVHFAAGLETEDEDRGPTARPMKRAENRGSTGMWRRGDGVCAKRQHNSLRPQ